MDCSVRIQDSPPRQAFPRRELPPRCWDADLWAWTRNWRFPLNLRRREAARFMPGHPSPALDSPSPCLCTTTRALFYRASASSFAARVCLQPSVRACTAIPFNLRPRHSLLAATSTASGSCADPSSTLAGRPPVHQPQLH